MNWPNKAISVDLADRLISFARANGVRALIEAHADFNLSRVEVEGFVARQGRLLPMVPASIKIKAPVSIRFGIEGRGR